MTLTAYAGHSVVDAALKPSNRQWTPGNQGAFVGRQVGLM